MLPDAAPSASVSNAFAHVSKPSNHQAKKPSYRSSHFNTRLGVSLMDGSQHCNSTAFVTCAKHMNCSMGQFATSVGRSHQRIGKTEN